MKVRIEPVTASLRAPFAAAYGRITKRELLVLSLEDAEGRSGSGEAAPLEPYDGVSIAGVRSALEDCRGALEDSDGHAHAELLASCRERAVLPQAVAAIDLALWDLAGRRSGRPVRELLGAADREPVEVNATITAEDRAGAASEAAAIRGAGFGCLKLKVGIGDDAGRLAAVRAAAGPEMRIRVDANGVWSPEEAVAWLRALAPAGIELCEEPTSGLEAIAAVAREAEVPVALDESAALPGALASRACSAVCLKVARCGGISGLIEAATQARRVGYDVYLASTLDGPLGIAAALHAAAAIAPERACGLGTLGLFGGRPAPLSPRHGRMPWPAGPGLGDGLLSWYLLD